MPCKTLARSEQTQSQIQIIVRNALRAAAMASTYQDALDIAGAALLAVADLSRGEVRHA